MTVNNAQRFGCVAIVPAGGSGARFGATVPKQYSVIAGRTVIEHSLRALQSCAAIEHIFVSVQDDDTRADEVAAAVPGVTFLRCAGATRADTVRSALRTISKQIRRDAWVLVHDAARPCVLASDVARLVELVDAHAVGGLLATPVADTLKRATADNEIAETISRENMWRAQTPQMFRYETLVHALNASPDVTDEAQAIEALGMTPLLVAGSARNIKITLPEDAELAEFYLTRRAKYMVPFRVGTGFDVHQLVVGRALVIGGVTIPYERGLLGHSDADVLLHAIADALLGAAALGDIGKHFPDSDPTYNGADSRTLLRTVVRRVREAGWQVGNIDATIIAQAPKMAPHIEQMRMNIASDCGVAAGAINVKATTTEQLGFTGRGEGIAAQASALLAVLASV